MHINNFMLFSSSEDTLTFEQGRIIAGGQYWVMNTAMNGGTPTCGLS